MSKRKKKERNRRKRPSEDWMDLTEILDRFCELAGITPEEAVNCVSELGYIDKEGNILEKASRERMTKEIEGEIKWGNLRVSKSILKSEWYLARSREMIVAVIERINELADAASVLGEAYRLEAWKGYLKSLPILFRPIAARLLDRWEREQSGGQSPH